MELTSESRHENAPCLEFMVFFLFLIARSHLLFSQFAMELALSHICFLGSGDSFLFPSFTLSKQQFMPVFSNAGLWCTSASNSGKCDVRCLQHSRTFRWSTHWSNILYSGHLQFLRNLCTGASTWVSDNFSCSQVFGMLVGKMNRSVDAVVRATLLLGLRLLTEVFWFTFMERRSTGPCQLEL